MTLMTSKRVDSLKSSVFAVLAKRLEGYTGQRYPFHIGDNAIAPPGNAQWGNVDVSHLGNPYRYGHPHGEAAFREALADKVRQFNDMHWVNADHIRVSAGATHGLTCTVQALLNPGDEVLILAPYWPLFRGICHCAAVTPSEVPFYQRLLDEPDVSPSDIIEPYVSERTRALYLINPNNPNGIVLSRAQLQSISSFAQKHNLWVISDEAYESYVFEGSHTSIATLPGMAERTISAFTFSKSYAMAGTRVGYLVAPKEAAFCIGKVATHSVYNTAQVCQAAAMGALAAGNTFLSEACATYGAYADIVNEHLNATFHRAQGSVFVFLDLREYGSDCMAVLEQLADRGVTLAPGVIFGEGFGGYARMCFTAVDGDTLRRGINVINDVLAAQP